MKAVQALLAKHHVQSHLQHLLKQIRPFRVLGLDINTKTTGYVVLNEKGRLVKFGHVSTKHLSSEIQMLDIGIDITNALKELAIPKQENITWLVGIEDFLKTYASGRFHTKGLFQLAQLNGLISYSCLLTFGTRPQHIHPTSARAFFRLAKDKEMKKRDAIKHVVMDFALSMEPNLSFPEKNSVGYRYDIADAYVIAFYTYWQHVATLACDKNQEWTQVVIADLNQLLDKQMTRKAALPIDFDSERYLDTVLLAHVQDYIKDIVHDTALLNSIRPNANQQ
ncbi:hypothetical protein THRCLA_09164 [Thraustotheca clavata]|uniref:Uncharacterized protein n=1 Tax=Thraustotheca clavata TaxID=74557 RepID=A0A1V9YYT7_9STRA|nr:hypothetical protein THRCLA_09164 [Thraustotheca clavata]